MAEKKDDANEPRIILVQGMVNEELTKKVIEKLLKFQNINVMEEVTMIVDSYGGYVDSMFAITDMMDIMTYDVRTICVGKAMSAGAFIFTCGTKDKRFMTRKAQLMYHQIWSCQHGTLSDIDIEVENTKHMQKLLIDEVAARSKMNSKQVEKLIDRDAYVYPQQAIKLGLCDGIIKRINA